MEGWPQYAANVISLVVGAALALLGSLVAQRQAHSQQERARRAERLVDAYARWAALVEQLHTVLARLAWAWHRGGGGEEERARQDRLWNDAHTIDLELLTLTHTLQLLEEDPSKRAGITDILERTAVWKTLDGWKAFQAETLGHSGAYSPWRDAVLRLLGRGPSKGEAPNNELQRTRPAQAMEPRR